MPFVLISLFCSAGIFGKIRSRTTFQRYYAYPENQTLPQEEEHESNFLKTVRSSVYEAVSDFMAQVNKENSTTMHLAFEKAQKKALKEFEKQHDTMLSALKAEQSKSLAALEQHYLDTLKSQQRSLEGLLALANTSVQNTQEKLVALIKKDKDTAIAETIPAITVSENVLEKSVDSSAPSEKVVSVEQKKINTEIVAVAPTKKFASN